MIKNIDYLQLNKLYIQALMNEGWSYAYLSKLFNVSSGIIGRRIKKWGLKYSEEGLKKKKEIKIKLMKQTYLKKYGVENPMQCEQIQEKVKRTNLEKYGVEHPLQSKEIQEKRKRTNLEKYGVEHSFQSEEIKEKIKEINLKKYDVENPLQSEEIKEKKKQTILKKYGVENPLQSKEIQEKRKRTNLEKYGVKNITQKNIKHYNVWDDDERFINWAKTHVNKHKGSINSNIICNYFNVNNCTALDKIHYIRDNYPEYAYLFHVNLFSQLEDKVAEFLNNHNIKYIRHKYPLRDYDDKRLQIDFQLPEYKLALEVQDLATHSREFSEIIEKDLGYSLKKEKLCKEQIGYDYYEIWEDTFEEDLNRLVEMLGVK